MRSKSKLCLLFDLILDRPKGCGRKARPLRPFGFARSRPRQNRAEGPILMAHFSCWPHLHGPLAVQKLNKQALLACLISAQLAEYGLKALLHPTNSKIRLFKPYFATDSGLSACKSPLFHSFGQFRGFAEATYKL